MPERATIGTGKCPVMSFGRLYSVDRNGQRGHGAVEALGVRPVSCPSRPCSPERVRSRECPSPPPLSAPRNASIASPTPFATSSPRREGRGGRDPRALPEHRRSEPVRIPHAAASDRSGGARDARRPQRLYGLAGIVEAREAVAADFAGRGVRSSPDRVLITSGTSEGIELALTAIVDEGEGCSCRRRRIRSTRRCWRRSAPSRSTTGPIPPTLAAGSRRSAQRVITDEDARAGGDRSEQPDRRDLSGPRCAGS